MGVPTVVDAATLVNDTMDKMLWAMNSVVQGAAGESAKESNATTTEGDAFINMLGSLEDGERYGLITEILADQNMFVTPKDVDAVIQRLANIIANTLNISLHPGITSDDVNRYL